jgi:hypothetical protein
MVAAARSECPQPRRWGAAKSGRVAPRVFEFALGARCAVYGGTRVHTQRRPLARRAVSRHMSGNGRLGTIGIGPDLLILPDAVHWLLAVQGALVAWLVFHVVGACAAYSLVATARNKTIDASEPRRLTKEAARSLVDAFTEPFFVLISYFVQLISFLVSNAGRVVLVLLGCSLAYIVVQYQRDLIVTIDSTYNPCIQPSSCRCGA